MQNLIYLRCLGHVACMVDDRLPKFCTPNCRKGLETEVAQNLVQRCYEVKLEDEWCRLQVVVLVCSRKTNPARTTAI